MSYKFTRNILVVLLTMSVFCGIVSAQNLANQKSLADSLFNSKEYFDAITEYKRLKFFDENGQYKYELNLKIGMAYKAGARLENAARYFAQAVLSANNPRENFEAMIEAARVEILNRNSRRALQLLNELVENEEYTGRINEIIYWRGWTYIFADEWENASGEFSKIDTEHELVKLCKEVAEKKLSVTFAKVISYILPGSGQFYSGEYLSGFLSLAWNLFLGYHTIDAIGSERVFDALVIGNLAWLRFYRGNIQNAEQFAVEKNIEIANEALYYLQTNYEGIKP